MLIVQVSQMNFDSRAIILIATFTTLASSTATLLPPARIPGTMCTAGRTKQLRFIEATGSRYQIGLQIGQAMRGPIQAFHAAYSDLSDVFLPFYE